MKTSLIKAPHMQNSPIAPGEPVKAPVVQGEPVKPPPACDLLSHINCPVKPPVIQCRPPSKIGCVVGDAPADAGYYYQQESGFGGEVLFAVLVAWVLR
jgi:hypothetical protein